MSKQKSPLYLVNAVLASGVMYFVLDLSSSGRTAIDWTVIGLVAGAILFNLVQLGRRLHELGGARDVGRLLYTVGFWFVGLMNTVRIRPEAAGTWKHNVGWALLVCALIGTGTLFRKERRGTQLSEAKAEE